MGRIILILFLSLLFDNPVYPKQEKLIMAIKSENIPLEPYNIALKGFKDYMDSQGEPCQIIKYELSGEKDFSALSKEIEMRKPDLLLTAGTNATRFAQEAIKGIPILFILVLHPEAGNLSPPGVTMDIPFPTRLKNLKRVFPRWKKIGLVYSAQSGSMAEEILQACSNLGFQLIKKGVDLEMEFPPALNDILPYVDFFMMVPDPKVYFPKSTEYLLRESLARKIPVVGLSSSYAKAGALISFDCDYEDIGSQAAEAALRIFSGAGPSMINFVAPRKVKISLNLLMVRRLELEIPQEVIEEASEVFGK